MFSSRTGQWLSEDPIVFLADDPNLKRYVANSATMATDPTGLFGSWGGAGMVSKDGKLINPFSGKTVPPTPVPPIVGADRIMAKFGFTPKYIPGGIAAAGVEGKKIELPNDVPKPIANSLWQKEAVQAALLKLGYPGDLIAPWTHNVALMVELSHLYINSPTLCTPEHLDERINTATPGTSYYNKLVELKTFIINSQNGVDSTFTFAPPAFYNWDNSLHFYVNVNLSSKNGVVTGGPNLTLQPN